jgi:hypothetical protein
MRKVKAKDLIRELTQDPGRMVSRLRKRRPLLPLRDATIVGKFDLSNHTVKKPISFQNCEFEGDVDLRYAEFERNVDFVGCTFHREFKGGNYKEPRAMYRKDLNCSKSLFRSPATFIGIKVGNSGYFDECRFEFEGTEGPTVDFTGASFGSNIECIDALFKGPVSFNCLQCGDRGVFNGAEFGSEGKSTSVDFASASFGRNFECVGTVFNGSVVFNGLRCDVRGIFRDARFGDEVSLRSASFGSHLVCTGAVFKGPVSLNSLKCDGNGYFERCEFELEELEKLEDKDKCTVDFANASIGSHLVCTGAVFKGPVSLNSLKCDGSGHFQRAKFKRFVEFRLATFGLVLRCPEAEFGGQVDASWVKCAYESSFERAIFKEEVRFRGLRCGTTGRFKGATFEGDELVDFRHSRFEADLDLRGVYFAGKVILGQASVLNKLRLGGACFSGDTGLFGSNINILELMDANYFPEDYPPSFKVRTSKEQEEEGFKAVVSDRQKLNKILNQGTSENIQRIIEACYPFLKDKSALIDTIFERNENIKRKVEAFFPFREGSLTLSDTTFERFHGGPNGELARRLALKLAKEQVSTRFSRDPYLQLEKYYARIGEEDDAVKMHRRGHSALRENAKDYRNSDKEGNVKWSWYKIWVTDLGLKYLTGYGSRAWLAVVYLLPLLMIGTFVFCGDNTLLTKGDLDKVGYVSAGHSFAYTLDLLIPVLTFPLTDSWVANHTWGKIISVIAVLAGWLLVPLFIAAWSGLIRPRNQ